MNEGWVQIFFTKPVLVVLSRYLSFVDIIHLSCLSKQMYNPWIGDPGISLALNLYARIQDATGRTYKARHPMQYLRKAASIALRPVVIADSTKFVCFRCDKPAPTKSIGNRGIFPYATCGVCVASMYTRCNDFCVGIVASINYILNVVNANLGFKLKLDELSLEERDVIYKVIENSKTSLYQNGDYVCYSKDLLVPAIEYFIEKYTIPRLLPDPLTFMLKRQKK